MGKRNLAEIEFNADKLMRALKELLKYAKGKKALRTTTVTRLKDGTIIRKVRFAKRDMNERRKTRKG